MGMCHVLNTFSHCKVKLLTDCNVTFGNDGMWIFSAVYCLSAYGLSFYLGCFSLLSFKTLLGGLWGHQSLCLCVSVPLL
jgi:hypothetical protein